MFLSNTQNKYVKYITLSEILEKEGFKIIQAPNDANILLALTALVYSKQKQVQVIGEDTNILALPWHYINKDVHQVMFQSESNTWNIQHLLHKIGQMIEMILLIHAFLGCNTYLL